MFLLRRRSLPNRRSKCRSSSTFSLPDMRRVLWQAILIVLIGLGAGLLGNAISPRAIPFLAPAKKPVPAEEYIPLGKAKDLWSSGTTVFVDAREPADYEAGHIGNALNLPAL